MNHTVGFISRIIIFNARKWNGNDLRFEWPCGRYEGWKLVCVFNSQNQNSLLCCCL